MMRRIKLVCLLFFVLLVVGWGLRMTPNPLQTPATALRKNLLQTFVTCPSFTAAILALGSKATADEVKKKFEYMPALQGLDYGKVMVIFDAFLPLPFDLLVGFVCSHGQCILTSCKNHLDFSIRSPRKAPGEIVLHNCLHLIEYTDMRNNPTNFIFIHFIGFIAKHPRKGIE